MHVIKRTSFSLTQVCANNCVSNWCGLCCVIWEWYHKMSKCTLNDASNDWRLHALIYFWELISAGGNATKTTSREYYGHCLRQYVFLYFVYLLIPLHPQPDSIVLVYESFFYKHNYCIFFVYNINYLIIQNRNKEPSRLFYELAFIMIHLYQFYNTIFFFW